jgi:hypothetical protein
MRRAGGAVKAEGRRCGNMPALYVCRPHFVSEFVAAIHIPFDCPTCAYYAAHSDAGDAVFNWTSTLTMPEIDVRNLRVLVTSGGNAIGRAIAEGFAAFGAKAREKGRER